MKALMALLIFLNQQSFAATYKDVEEMSQFILIGDTGKANDGQIGLAKTMGEKCLESLQCDAGILLGDNVYHAGLEHENDPKMDLVFGDIYRHLNFPFFALLGNHDYGKLGRNWKKSNYQIAYAKKNAQFILPSRFYIKEYRDLVVAYLDTSRLMWRLDYKKQKELVDKAYKMAKGKNKWFMVAGHHPFLSNGPHGNAGNYERLKVPYFVSGIFVKNFIEKYVCGKADFYIAGHDHSLQAIDGKQAGCDTYTLVSGSGASGTKLTARNKEDFQTIDVGFFHFATSLNKVSLSAINTSGNVLFYKEFTK